MHRGYLQDGGLLPHVPVALLGHPALLLTGTKRAFAAGVSFRQDVLNRLLPASEEELHWYAWLTPEPRNAHDPNAVAVHIMGHQVAYLPGELAAEVSDLLGSMGRVAPVACLAHVMHSNRSANVVVALFGDWPEY